MIETLETKDLQLYWKEGKGHTAVTSRAGTGKTTEQVEFAKRLKPQYHNRMWCTSHSNAINDKTKERVPEGVHVKGLHKVGLALLYSMLNPTNPQYVQKMKYSYIVRDIAPQYIEKGNLYKQSKSIVDLFNLCRAYMIDLDNLNELQNVVLSHLLDFQIPLQTASTMMKEMADRGMKEARYRVDLTDMLWLPLVMNIPVITQYKWSFLDEAQDCTMLHARFWLKMSEGARCMLLFDDRQAIYSFMGANGEPIDMMIKSLGNSSVGLVEKKLSVCHRCPTLHLDHARKIVPDIQNAPDAQVGEINEVRLMELYRTPPKPGSAVICRTNAPGIDFTRKMVEKGIKCEFSGRHIGYGLTDLAELVWKRPDDFKFGAMRKLESWLERKVSKLSETDGNEMVISSYVDRADSLRRLYYSADDENITELKQFVDFTLSHFGDNEGNEKEKITVSSIHGYKGREAQDIYILNPDQIRHPKANTPLQWLQESNGEYIAYTRAKQSINLVQDSIGLEYAL